MKYSILLRSAVFVLIPFIFCIACSNKTKQILDASSDSSAKGEARMANDLPDESLSIVEPSQIPSDDRLTQGVLSNGLKYYIHKNVKPENRAELRLVVNAGSILEDEDQKGLAHFIEHMAFNGTKNFEKSELVDYLESVGARFGPDLNAYTSFDETVYMLQVRTDSAELLDKGLLILSDWASGVTFDEEEIDKERGVVESEWRSGLSADQRMRQQYLPILYHGSRYAKRLPIGDPNIINNAPYDVVKRFYKDWYRPDLMAVVVVGDIEVEQIENQIKVLFEKIAEPSTPRPRNTYDVPRHPETLISVVSDEEASFTNVRVVYKHDRVKTNDLDGLRASLIRNLYNSMLGARLQEITKQPDPPFLFASSGYGGDIGELDTYSSFAFVPEGKAGEALETILTENKRVLLHGFTSGEIERAKKNMMEGAERSFKEMDKTESKMLARRYVAKYLDDIPTPSPKQTLDLVTTYLPTIDLAEVNALASQWIRDESRVVVITGPEKDGVLLPEEGAVKAMLDRADELEVAPYQDDVIDQPFFTKELEIVPIVREENFAHVDIEFLELANGVEVYLKKTDFKNDQILMSATSPGGSSLYTDEEYFNAANATSIVNEAGIGIFSPTQLEKLMAGKSASARPYIGTLSEGFQGGASPDDVELMFQMIYKYFYEPRIDEEAFESFVTKQRGLYKNLMSNPQYFFSDYVSKKKFNNHPRVGFPEDEDWQHLDYQLAMQIYKERFADASDFTFSFVGNFDPATLKPLIQKYLGNLPNIQRDEQWKDVGVRPVAGELKDRIKRGEAPKTNVHMYFHGEFDYNKDNNYLLNSLISYLRIKLREELREDLGGVYGVGIRGGGSRKPVERYGITITFNADPPMTDTLVRAAKNVISRAIMEGPSEEDMTKIKETQRQSRIKALKENSFWQRVISTEHEEDQTFDNVLLDALEVRIQGLTAAQIQSGIGHYFDYTNYLEIIMDPEPQKSN